MGSLPLEFFVAGEPKGAGSKVSGVVTRKDPVSGQRVPVQRPGGGWKTFTKDSSGDAGENWRADVRTAAQRAIGPNHELVDGPLVLTIIFQRLRPQSHFGSGRNAGVLKPTAPAFPTTKPDTTKLLRAVEDALTKVVWTDDSRVVTLRVDKIYASQPGALIVIEHKLASAPGVQAVTPVVEPLDLFAGVG